MKVLAWYSLGIVILGGLGCLNSWVTNPIGPESGSNFWGFVLFTPVAVYLWKKARKEK